MAFTTPATVAPGQTGTSVLWNQQVRDNVRYLKGLDGLVQIDDSLLVRKAVGGGLGARLLLVNPSGGGSTVALDLSGMDVGSNDPEARLLAADVNFSADLLFLTKTPGAVANSLQQRMRIMSGGAVIIGSHTSPLANTLLDVRGGGASISGTGAGTGTTLALGAQATGNRTVLIDMAGDATYSDGLRIVRDNGGANTTSRIVHRGTGALQLNASDNGSVEVQISGTTRVRATGAAIQLLSGVDGTEVSVAGAMRLRAVAGGVMLGNTTTPSAPLHVQSPSGNTVVKVEALGANDFAQLHFITAGRTYHIASGGNGAGTGPYANSWYVFDATAGAPRLFIDSSGNVGIGTTNPGNKLDVIGIVRFDPSNGAGRETYFSNSVVIENGTANGTIAIGATAGTTNSITLGHSGRSSLQGYASTIQFQAGSNTVLYGGSASFAIQNSGPASLNPNGNRFIVLGDIEVNQGYKPGGGSWAATSDARTKDVLGRYTAGLKELRSLEIVEYAYNGRAGTPRGFRAIGLVAQQAQRAMPELVGTMRAKLDPEDTEETDVLTLDGSPLPYAIINALCELANRVEALEARKRRA